MKAKAFIGALSVCASFVAHAQAPGAKDALPLDEMRRFADLYHQLRSEHIDRLDPKRLFEAAMRAMVAAADPESEYFDRAALQAVRRRRPSEAAANAGLRLDHRDGVTRIVGALDGAAAASAGLAPRDRLLRIDGRSVLGLRQSEIEALLDGALGSDAVLEVAREGVVLPVNATLKRAAAPPNVTARLLGPARAYLRVVSFDDRVIAQANRELTRVAGAQPIEGLVLDLRGNPGGLLDTAFAVAAAFLPPGTPLVRAVERGLDALDAAAPARETTHVADDNAFRLTQLADLRTLRARIGQARLVVLIDAATAAGCELVASALAQNRRATLVGSRTYGRGSIQVWRMLDQDSAVKITRGRWTALDGSPIDGHGVTPHFGLADDGRFAQPDDAIVAQAEALLPTAPAAPGSR